MKKYISAILIDALLLQFCGCYSQKEITLDELNTDEEEIQFVTKDSSNYFLKRELTNEEIRDNPDYRFSDDWLINPELGLINIIYNSAYKDANETNKYYVLTDTSNVNFSEIVEISAQRFDGLKAGIGITLAIAFLYLIIVNADGMFDFSTGPIF
jgi:hypothetical protein